MKKARDRETTPKVKRKANGTIYKAYSKLMMVAFGCEVGRL